MAKIKKRDFTRGTKLTAENWNDNVKEFKELLSNPVPNENLQLNKGKFSLTFNWPRLLAEYFAYTNETDILNDRYAVESQGISVPIVLPPLQDFWKAIPGSYPTPLLKTMSVSFDNYMSNVGVCSESDGKASLSPVKLNASRYTMNIQIRERDQLFYTNQFDAPPDFFNNPTTREATIAPKVVYKTRVDGISFNSTEARFNPYFISGIDKQLLPQKTYLLKIDFPDVWPNDRASMEHILAPVSLTLKLDFEIGMFEKDVYIKGDEAPLKYIQNFPYNTLDNESTSAFTVDAAVAGQNITARAGVAGNGRIQTNLEKIDKRLIDALKSGMDLRSNPALQHIINNDASYFSIAVPMFNGFLDIRASDLNNWGLPYGAQGTFGGGDPRDPLATFWNGILFDQRVIPISQPCTIHHVIAVWDVGSHYVAEDISPGRKRIGSATAPFSPLFHHEVGVGIASGIRSESKRYQQVAYTKTTNIPDAFDMVVDGVVPPFYGYMTDPLQPYSMPFDQIMFGIPLMPNVTGGKGTRGYVDQGSPFFVGKSDLNTHRRTQVGDMTTPGTTITSKTVGEELYLDVRWKMYDTSVQGLSYIDQAATYDPPEIKYSYRPQTQYIGTSGCWIYIIGKNNTAL